jgi:quinol monooxygenase YgiN
MIVISGTVVINPAQREAAAQAARDMIRATRQEPGCRAYRFSFDLDDPNTVHIFEEWESAEALTAHFQTPHMATFQQRLPALLGGPIRVMRYDVSAVTQMM